MSSIFDESADVAVIGAGVTGLSVAWHLARRSAGRIVVLERSGVGAEASGVQPGGVRQQWATAVSCDLAQESVAFYLDVAKHLEPRSGARLERCGYAFLADSQTELDRLRAAVELQNGHGIPSRLVDAAELAELVPGLDVAGVAGASWCEDDGYFDKPQGVVEAFAEAAQREGVTIEIAHVDRLEQRGDHWDVIAADGVTLAAEQVVVATGYGTPELARSLELDLPIAKEPRYLFLSDPIEERLLEPLVVASERRFAAKQLANGRVLASDLSAEGDPEAGRQRWRANVSAAIRALVPILEFVSFPLLLEGSYDVTPDHQPILGPVDGRPGLWLAAGFSGHGFMMAPAIGRRLAAAITGDPLDASLAALSITRFAQPQLTHELQIV